MAKVKYDVRKVEPRKRGDFKTPKPGVYRARIREAELRQDDGKNDIALVYEITKGEFADSRLWDYVPLGEASAFRVKELVDALGLKGKGSIDTDKLVGKELQVRVKHETYQGDPRAKPNGLLPLGAADDEDDEEDEDGDGLEEMDRSELKSYIKENELEIKVTKKMSDDDIVEAIREAEGEEEDDEEEPDDEEEEDDEEEGDDEDEDEDDYDEWGMQELKDELKQRGLKTSGKKGVLIKRLRDDDAEDEDDEEPF